MLAHEALHLFGLLHRFGEQVSPQAAEQRQVGLVEQSQFVEPFVNFGLDGPLREAQVVHVAELRQQDVVDELGRVAPDYTLLQVPHRVGSPQADLLSVQVHAPARHRNGVHRKTAHAELLLGRVEFVALLVLYGHLQLVEPRRVRIPPAETGHVEGDAQVVDPVPHLEPHRLVVGRFGKVAHAGDKGRRRNVFHLFEDRLFEVLSVYRDDQLHVFLRFVEIIYFHPRLGPVLFGQRTHEQVVYVHRVTGLDAAGLVDAHTGGTVVPSLHRFVVTGTRSRIDFVTAHVLAAQRIAGRRIVVADLHENRVFARTGQFRDVELEWREEAGMRTGQRAVHVDFGLVIHPFETDEQRPRAEHRGRKVDHLAVVGHRTAQRRSVVRNLHCGPFAFAALDRGEITGIGFRPDPPVEHVERHARAGNRQRRGHVFHIRGVLFPQLRQFGLQLSPGREGMHRPESSLRIVLHGQELLREFRRRRFDQRTAQLVAGGGDIGEFILRRQGRRRQRSGQGQQGEGHFRGSVHALRFLRVCGNCRSGTGGGEGTGEHKFTKSGRYFTIPRGRSAEYRGRRTTGTGNPFREMTGRRLGLRSESGYFGLQGPSEAGSRIEQNS